MKLMDAESDQVVRNARNGHFYRFVKREGRRVRIRPLELFPNGLLQAKTTDTIVEPDLEVEAIADWCEVLYVKAKTGKSRVTYERELQREMEKLVVLEAESLIIPPKERGSHANKVKSCQARVEVLQRGLRDRPDGGVDVVLATTIPDVAREFGVNDLVQLPSGRPGKLLNIERRNDKTIARVAIRGACGKLKQVELAFEALVSIDHRRMATI